MAGDPPEEPVTLRHLQKLLPSSDSIFPPNTALELLGFNAVHSDIARVRTFLSNNCDPVKSTSTVNSSSATLQGGSTVTLLSPTQALEVTHVEYIRTTPRAAGMDAQSTSLQNAPPTSLTVALINIPGFRMTW